MKEFLLEDFLPYKLSILSQSVSRLFENEYRTRFGLSMNEWRVLVIIGAHAPISAKNICTRTLFDKMTVSRTTLSLKAKKLVSSKSNEDDARITLHTLTPSGQNIYDEIIPIAKTYEKALIKQLSTTEHESFCAIIDQLINISNEMNGNHGE
jgi:DNA-binding MarR family transcriptional regulator